MLQHRLLELVEIKRAVSIEVRFLEARLDEAVNSNAFSRRSDANGLRSDKVITLLEALRSEGRLQNAE